MKQYAVVAVNRLGFEVVSQWVDNFEQAKLLCDERLKETKAYVIEGTVVYPSGPRD